MMGVIATSVFFIIFNACPLNHSFKFICSLLTYLFSFIIFHYVKTFLDIDFCVFNCIFDQNNFDAPLKDKMEESKVASIAMAHSLDLPTAP